MKIKIVSGVLLCLAAQTALFAQDALRLLPPALQTYQCSDGSKITAKYYNLSDHSLGFVKVTIEGVAYTLPTIVSASGARYSDMSKIQWWSSKNEVMLDTDIHDEQSKEIVCKEVNQ